LWVSACLLMNARNKPAGWPKHLDYDAWQLAYQERETTRGSRRAHTAMKDKAATGVGLKT
jgi:hypothetical protein